MPLTTDEEIAALLRQTRTIALVGWSPKPERPSHRVAAFLAQRYRVIPVNPAAAGQRTPWGETVHASLAEIGAPIDLVDIFRNSDDAGATVDEALALPTRPKAIWMQLGVINPDAAARAEALGLQTVMDRCPAIEIPRLGL
jgi:predicted CoA-binding protein